MRLLLILLSTLLYSCNRYYIVKDYEHSPQSECDCYVKPKFVAGKMNERKNKQIAKCTSKDYSLYTDTLSQLWEEYNSEDEENVLLEQKIGSLESKRLKYKIKVKEKTVFKYRLPAEYSLKKKIIYYKEGVIGFRRFKKEVIVQDSTFVLTNNIDSLATNRK